MTNITTHSFNVSFKNFGALDLYSSSIANETTPLIVFIHGGAWRSEDKNDHKQLAMDLSNRGFTVAVTNYRLSLRDKPEEQPKVQHPCHIQDTYEALTFLHNHYDQLLSHPVYDQNKVFLAGHSAGAHIATMLLLEPTQYSIPYVKGIIGADGIYDLPLLLQKFPTYFDFVSQAFGLDTSTYMDASPIGQFPSSLPYSIPVLILQSLDDQLIDIGQAESIVHHLKKLNINVTLDDTLKGDHYDMIKTTEFITAVTQFVNSLI